MSTSIEGVEVALGRLALDPRKFGITVKVRSRRKKHIKFQVEVDPGMAVDQNGVFQLIAVAAGACCEELGKKYGDNIDPSQAGALALRAFREECHRMNELAKGVPEKVKRVATYRSLLSDPHREFLEHCEYFLRRGDQLTPKEVELLDFLVNQLHARQL